MAISKHSLPLRMTTYLHNLLLLIIAFSLVGPNLWAQDETKDTLIIIGQEEVDTSFINISKADFLKVGKIKTNQKGWSVNSYNFSMFALGNSIKCTVNDSMYTTKLREAIQNKKINYRYINIEGIKLIDKQGNTLIPKVDTVKVKFIYQ